MLKTSKIEYESLGTGKSVRLNGQGSPVEFGVDID